MGHRGRRWRRRAIALAAGVAAGVALSAWGTGASAIEFEPPPPPRSHEERVSAVTPAGRALYSLPADWRTASGGIDQKAIVAHQKKRLKTINKALGTDLQMAETRHYLIFSDAGRRVSLNFLRWSEALYRNLLKQFALSASERVWDGKCVLILFRHRRRFEAYAKRFDGMMAASRAGAYFGIEAHGPDGPSLVHICIPIETDAPRRLQELFAHEGTHAFFELYKTQGRLPLWLHEGLAEYMTTVNDKALRPQKWEPAERIARSGRSIRAIFQVPMGGLLTLGQYRVALTLVDFLLAAGRRHFKTFVENLKDGMPQEEALRKAYGFGLRDLERRWRIYVRHASPDAM